jgi:hypothetical protein
MRSFRSCRFRLTTLVIIATASQVDAQMSSAQPYSSLQYREIKALSAEDITALNEGRGMGLAVPAELNAYPGPVHVLELADRLASLASNTSGLKLRSSR